MHLLCNVLYAPFRTVSSYRHLPTLLHPWIHGSERLTCLLDEPKLYLATLAKNLQLNDSRAVGQQLVPIG